MVGTEHDRINSYDHDGLRGEGLYRGIEEAEQRDACAVRYFRYLDWGLLHDLSVGSACSLARSV